MRAGIAWLTIFLLAAAGCDRRIEPFVPGEKPQAPDLAKIFPAGAERAAKPAAELPAPPERGAPPVAAPTRPIEGTIELAPELAGRVPTGAVLFLIARSAERGPPLAVVRIADPEFPLPFSIGPDDRMIAELPFAGEIRISARVDSDGDAASRSPGDLQGRAEMPHSPGDRGVVLVISELL